MGLEDGEQVVQIRFANGSSNARSMQLSVNDSVIIESLVFNPTGNWTTWDTLSVSVNFDSGISLLRLTSSGGEGGPNIDQLEISGEALPDYKLNLSASL